MSDFDPKWPHGHVTRDGRKARVIAGDIRDVDYPIVAAVTSVIGTEIVESYTADGRYSAHDEATCRSDLLNAPAPKRRHVRWVNMYPDRIGMTSHGDKSSADLRAAPGRIACLRIEFEEGEGL